MLGDPFGFLRPSHNPKAPVVRRPSDTRLRTRAIYIAIYVEPVLVRVVIEIDHRLAAPVVRFGANAGHRQALRR
jgi:hypothetical protein